MRKALYLLFSLMVILSCQQPENIIPQKKTLSDVVDDNIWINYLPNRWVYYSSDAFDNRYTRVTVIFNESSDNMSYEKEENTSSTSYVFNNEKDSYSFKIENNILYVLSGSDYKRFARLSRIDNQTLYFYKIIETSTSQTETFYNLLKADYIERPSDEVIDNQININLLNGTWNCTEGLSYGVESEKIDFSAKKNYFIKSYQKNDGSSSSYKYEYYSKDNIIYYRQWDLPSYPHWSQYIIENGKISFYSVWNNLTPVGNPSKVYEKSL